MKRLLAVCVATALWAVLPTSPVQAGDSTGQRSDLRNHVDGNAAQVKLHDNGDGTFSEQVYSSAAALPSGAATAAGAAHEANSQVTASTSAATLIVARPTRRSCLIKNTDASITVYIGAATVTSANGMPLKAGESVAVSAVTLWQVIAASGSPVVAVVDEYD